MKEEKEGNRRGVGLEPGDERRAATLRVIERHGAQVMRTARRYAANQEDAEDAYQRAVEIMLTKAPEIPDAELLPWLKTVVRHEAFALRRKDERLALGAVDSFDGTPGGGDAVPSLRPTPAEQAERFERLRLGAEALNGLKPQEARALTLLAQGYSYSQICEKTGWTYTKVNRCLAEGRKSFVKRVAGIESGEECERLAPKLSALADGEASAGDVALLRRHLQGCHSCRASLREQSLAPAAVGALLPAPFLDEAIWVFERATELVSELKLKLASLVRVPSLDSTSGVGQVAISESSRGFATGLTKGLAVLCIGGAGAGGMAVCIDPMLESPGARSARAAPGDGREGVHRRQLSPDPKLVAERFNGATATADRHASSGDERSSTSTGVRETQVADRPIAPILAGAREPVGSHSREASGPTKYYFTPGPNSNTGAVSGEHTGPATEPSPDGDYKSDTTPSGGEEYGSGAPDPPPSEYGSGAPDPPPSEYGSGAPDPPPSK